MPFVILPTNSASGGYDITNSLRFNSGSSDNLSRTTGSTGNRKTVTFSGWFKRSSLSGNQMIFSWGGGGLDVVNFFFNGSPETLNFYNYPSSLGANFTTNQLFRDVSAWYHIVLAVDTTQATSSNRIKLYVNGSQVTSFSSITYPTLNEDFEWNVSGESIRIGANYSVGDFINGYLAETYIIDGQQLTPSSFGETDEDTGIWKPKAFSGTYGTNGFYLQFKNSASLGTDSSGNGNTFTVNNLTSIDQTTDTPTNNFATLISNFGVRYSTQTYSEGNLKVAGGSGFELSPASIAPSSGKWYFEAKMESLTSYPSIGFQETSQARTNNKWIAETTQGWGLHFNGQIYNNNNSVGTLTSYTTGDIMALALDLDNGKAYFRKNGTWLGSADPATSTNPAISSIPAGTYYLGVSNYDSTWGANFGNPYYSANSYTDGAGYGNFSYAVPSGYYALNTKNLATFG